MPGKRPARRAPTACEFCRHRKLKCSNEKPRCQNCLEYNKDCVYSELEKKPRPSYARIMQLELENQQLRDNLNKGLGCGKDTSVGEPSETQTSSESAITSIQTLSRAREELQLPTPGSTPRNATTVQRIFAPDTVSCYHGPTSALYDEDSVASDVTNKSTSSVKTPSVWTRRQLVAETASQRQFETVNFLAGKLDFDGVDPELGMQLLSIYWNRQLSLGPVVYRTAFMRDMACAGPNFSKLLLNAIYFYSSKYSSRIEVCRSSNNKLTAGMVYRQRAMELLAGCYDKSKISTIQALLIMSSALFTWCDEKSLSWLYAGMAFTMITDLGIQVGPNTLKNQFSEEDLEIRTRVFWAAYVIDKLQSLYQGRPTSLHKPNTNLSIAITDDHEELELFSTLTYSESTNNSFHPVYSLSIFKETCRLAIILDKIILSLYSEESSSTSFDVLLRKAVVQANELESWRRSLQPHLNIDLVHSDNKRPLPHLLALLSMFNVLIILIHRPFVSNGHLHSESSSTTMAFFSRCSEAAFEIDKILETYERFYCIKTAPYIISYATYVSATIHVRLAAQQISGSNAHKALRRCLDVLYIHQSIAWAPKRARRVIENLVTRLGIVFHDEEPASTTVNPQLSDLDIDAIMQSFVMEHQGTDQLEPPNTSSRRMAGDVSTTMNYSATQPSDVAMIENTSYSESTMPSMRESMPLFMYDPIFGINGMSYDDWDLIISDETAGNFSN